MGCHPVAVVDMHVHKYEIDRNEFTNELTDTQFPLYSGYI